MSNDKQISNPLELEEKMAVGVVFLLAGWFLWHNLGNTLKLADTEPQVLEEPSSKALRFENEYTARIDQTVSSRMDDSVSSIDHNAGTSIAAPVIQAVQPESRETRISPLAPRVHAPVAAITTPETIIPTESISSPFLKQEITNLNKEIEKDKVSPIITEQVEPEPEKIIVATPPPPVVTKSIATRASLTIQPITSDLSQGELKLSGTGHPGSHLQLLLNGRKVSNIAVDRQGVWQYETNLKPGDYSIQVLSFPGNNQESMQSVLTRITMPELPIPTSSLGADNSIHMDNLSVENPPENMQLIATEIKPETIPEIKPVTPVIVETNSTAPINIVSKPQNKPRKLKGRLYRVRYGDTLNKLSNRFKVSLRRLTRANNISNKNKIKVDQMLIIPNRRRR